MENQLQHRITDASVDATNTNIQQVKRRSRGFGSRDRFREAIYFHCGGLDLYAVGMGTSDRLNLLTLRQVWSAI